MFDFSQRLLHSIRSAPLFVGDLEQALVFDRRLFDSNRCEAELCHEQKLGHLYEDAVAVLLQASSSVDLLARNLQVVDESGRTLGEFDYLLFDKLRYQYVHLELAVKFYLAVETPDGWQFPGPDPRDHWQRKLDRMRTHQFTLSHGPDARSLLLKNYGADAVQVRQLIYGCIYHPISSTRRPLPEAVNPQCRKGRWLYVSEWEEYLADIDSVQMIPKPMWPVEVNDALRGSLEVVSVDTLKSVATERCVLFVQEGSDEPVFLVPDNWLTVQNTV